MAMHFDPAGGEDDAPMAAINTTPLVDVMLVLLIIFLITIPVALQTVPVHLPHDHSQPNQTPPGTITLSVDRQGQIFWNDRMIGDDADLAARLSRAASQIPQPTIQVRGDRDSRFEPVGRLVRLCRQAGLITLGFVTEPGGQE